MARANQQHQQHQRWVSRRTPLRWLHGAAALFVCLLLAHCTEPLYTPCAQDLDCPSGLVCVAAGCVDKPQACVATCRKHIDCAACPTNQQFCSNGKCSGTPATCPDACKEDSECSPCPENRTKCINGACNRAPDCPTDCTKDADCAECGDFVCFKQKCTSKALRCPETCHIDRDCTACLEGSRACVGGTCRKESDACQNDVQCPEGTKCIWKDCTKDIVGQKCSQSCPVGFICTSGHCFEDCSNKPNLCSKNTADGRTFCVAVAYSDQNQISVCFGQALEGELCGVPSYNTPKQAFCKSGLFPPLFCNDEGVCQEATVQRTVGDFCHKRGEPLQPGETLKVCDQRKDPPLGCDNTKGKGSCVIATKAKAGLQCDATGLALGVPTLCLGSSVCIAIYRPYLEGRCFETCTTDGKFPCAQNGFECITYSLDPAEGVCLRTPCTTDEDCSFVGYQCKPGSAGGQRLCLPPVPSGGQAFGQLCGAKACQADFQCLSTSNNSDGFCTKACQAQKDCPTITDDQIVYRSLCYSVGTDGSQRRCLLQCNDGKCPSGLNCFEYNGRPGQKIQICLPPS